MLQISVYDFFTVCEGSQDDLGIPKSQDLDHFEKTFQRSTAAIISIDTKKQ